MADVGDHTQGPEPYHPSYEAPTTPFQRVVLPEEDQAGAPRQETTGPFRPPVAPGRLGLGGRLLASIGDIPIRIAYLAGTVVLTIAAVVLIFAVFSGDQPAPPATESQRVSGPPSPPSTELPPVPESMPFAALPGKAVKVVGQIDDKRTGITYPRLGKPWTPKSYPPFVIAQRVGKVAQPHTMVASALLPGAAPKGKPATPADYRQAATSAARWALRTQHPPGSTLTWTGSQKPAKGSGWVLGYRVDYTVDGVPGSSQAMVAVIEVGKKKPAMLLATIPDTREARWADLNTLVKGVRPR